MNCTFESLLGCQLRKICLWNLASDLVTAGAAEAILPLGTSRHYLVGVGSSSNSAFQNDKSLPASSQRVIAWRRSVAGGRPRVTAMPSSTGITPRRCWGAPSRRRWPRSSARAASSPCSRSSQRFEVIVAHSEPYGSVLTNHPNRTPRGPQAKTCSLPCSSQLLLLDRSLRKTRDFTSAGQAD